MKSMNLRTIVVSISLLAFCLAASAQSRQLRSTDLPAEARSAISHAVAEQGELTSSNGENYDQFGYSVAISGNTVVVGAPGTSGGLENGTVYVFEKPTSGWANMTQTAELTASSEGGGTQLGYSVAISGNTIVAGAPDSNIGTGAAYVFVEPTDGWTNMTQTAELLASDGDLNDGFGTSVGISGSTIVVGSPYHTVGSNPEQGAAYVFTSTEDVWSQAAEISSSDGNEYDAFGSAVATTGTAIVAGSPQATIGSNGLQGAAYVFTGSGATWTQKAKLTASNGFDGAHLGHSVAISGTTVVAGTYIFPLAQRQGAAYVFVEPTGGWVNATQTAELTANDPSNGDQLGWSVATTGSVVLMGAPNASVGTDTYEGTAYEFKEPAKGWATTAKYTAKFTETSGAVGDQFGYSVAIAGTTLVIGAQGRTVDDNVGQGVTYVY
jgi:FG-GAP repeat